MRIVPSLVALAIATLPASAQVPFTYYDVRTNHVVGNGTADDTTALQAAVSAACANQALQTRIKIPQWFNIKVSSTISFKGCVGLSFGGVTGEGADATSPTITWGGAAGGTVLAVDQAAASTFSNLAISVGVASVGIDDTQSGTVTQTNTDNKFDNISIFNSVADPSFVGIRFGINDTTGNVDLGVFSRISITCAGSSPSTTSNGKGVYIPLTNAEPYITSFDHWRVSKCSRAFDLEGSENIFTMDVGDGDGNYTDLYATTGSNIVYRNVRSENAIAPIVNSGADLTADHIALSGLLSGETMFTLSGLSRNNLDHIVIDNVAGVIPIANTSFGVNNNFSLTNSQVPNGTCPDISGYQGNSISYGNIQYAGAPCPDVEGLVNQYSKSLIGIGVLTTVNNSPIETLCGWYQSGAAPATYAKDCWSMQVIEGAGVNGTSTLTFTHTGTSGAATVTP